jgi:hypothetical protein
MEASSATGGFSDPAMALLALVVESRGAQNAVARDDVEEQGRLIEQAQAAIRDAMQRAEEAHEHAGFWGKLSEVFGGDLTALFGVIAAVAVTVGTGGAGAPAILAMTAAGLAAGAEVGERLGLDPRICAALGACGAVVGALGGNVSGLSELGQVVAQASNVASAVATGAGGACTIVKGQFDGDALDAQADEKQVRADRTQAYARIDDAVEVLRKVARDLERAQGTASTVVADDARANAMILARIGAA